MNFKVNDLVQRHQPGDYTHGRMGKIIEINETTQRARVRWAIESDGSELKTCNAKSGSGVRTWVAFKRLIKI